MYNKFNNLEGGRSVTPVTLRENPNTGTPPVNVSKRIGVGGIKKMIHNHCPEVEALRQMMDKLRRWDKKIKFEKKVEWLENKEKPEWMKNVQR